MSTRVETRAAAPLLVGIFVAAALGACDSPPQPTIRKTLDRWWFRGTQINPSARWHGVDEALERGTGHVLVIQREYHEDPHDLTVLRATTERLYIGLGRRLLRAATQAIRLDELHTRYERNNGFFPNKQPASVNGSITIVNVLHDRVEVDLDATIVRQDGVIAHWAGRHSFMAEPLTVQLPRPNSGDFTESEAAERQGELYSLVPTPMHPTWRSCWGSSFGIHITGSDTLVAYSHDILNEGKATRVDITELPRLLEYRGDFRSSDPLHVLVTCERDPNSSTLLPSVARLLFKPSIQVHYMATK
jgi:hypothetical protein